MLGGVIRLSCRITDQLDCVIYVRRMERSKAFGKVAGRESFENGTMDEGIGGSMSHLLWRVALPATSALPYLRYQSLVNG